MGGGGGETGGSGLPLEFTKLNIADINGNEKISYFSYLCTSTVLRQTESIHKTSIQVFVMVFFLVKVGPPPWKNFLDPRLNAYCHIVVYEIISLGINCYILIFFRFF